jgi:hypothetical protein
MGTDVDTSLNVLGRPLAKGTCVHEFNPDGLITSCNKFFDESILAWTSTPSPVLLLDGCQEELSYKESVFF